MEAWGNSTAICLRLDEHAKKKKLASFRRFSTPTNPTPLNDDHNSCSSTIARLERVDADELFVSPLTLQSFTCESSTKAVGNLLWRELFYQPSILVFNHHITLQTKNKTSRGRARTKHKAGLRSAHGDTTGRAGGGWEDGVRDSEREKERERKPFFIFRFFVKIHSRTKYSSSSPRGERRATPPWRPLGGAALAGRATTGAPR